MQSYADIANKNQNNISEQTKKKNKRIKKIGHAICRSVSRAIFFLFSKYKLFRCFHKSNLKAEVQKLD